MLKFSNTVIRNFTLKYCEILAFYLYHSILELDQTCEIYGIEVNPNSIAHYLIKWDSKFIDILGINTEEDTIEYWKNEFPQREIKIVKLENVCSWLNEVGFTDYDNYSENVRTYAIACTTFIISSLVKSSLWPPPQN